MQLISINVGRRERLKGGSFDGATGIFKRPVAGPVTVGELGLEDDAVLNGRHHGGPDQAVYLYRQEDYDWWSRELGERIAPGSFGENLTISGLPGDLAIGSRLSFAAVVLEITAPRIPCNTLAARMGDAGFVRRFLRAERPGMYCRVISPGPLVAGEELVLAGVPGEQVTVLELFRASQRVLDDAELRRFLGAPIDQRTRAKFQGRLTRAR